MGKHSTPGGEDEAVSHERRRGEKEFSRCKHLLLLREREMDRCFAKLSLRDMRKLGGASAGYRRSGRKSIYLFSLSPFSLFATLVCL